ncbi:MAG: hypothetical protein ACI9CP_001904 [Cryomorphaceae bacterium]|jgi:uncharacterized protein (TIGR02453 family)
MTEQCIFEIKQFRNNQTCKSMIHFSQDFNQFFKELAANNHKDWFDVNRDRYHKTIKEPFEVFVSDLVDELKKDDPRLNINPKSAIFRINRDIRFSKDKSPYKLNRSAAIAPNGKKSIAQGGIYIEIGPGRMMVGGGAFHPDKEELQSIREAIADNPKRFRKAIEDEKFLKFYEEIYGDENKRLPSKELMEAAKKEPLIFKKNMYYFCESFPEMVTSDNLIQTIVEQYNAANLIRGFISKAVG